MSHERLTSSNAAVLFVDHQTGLANGVQTESPLSPLSPHEFINNVRALVTIAQIYTRSGSCGRVHGSRQRSPLRSGSSSLGSCA